MNILQLTHKLGLNKVKKKNIFISVGDGVVQTHIDDADIRNNIRVGDLAYLYNGYISPIPNKQSPCQIVGIFLSIPDKNHMVNVAFKGIFKKHA